MKKHPRLTKGFYKGVRAVADRVREDLVRELTSIATPEKDPTGWKRKVCIRKKLSAHRTEATATGGGPYNMQRTSSKAGAVAKLCDLYKAVEGIKGVQSFRVSKKEATQCIVYITC